MHSPAPAVTLPVARRGVSGARPTAGDGGRRELWGHEFIVREFEVGIRVARAEALEAIGFPACRANR